MSETDSQSAVPAAVPADDRNLAMLAHLLGIPTVFIGCLIIWLVNKNKPEKAFVSDQAREALNFQMTMILAWLATCALSVFISTPILITCDFVFCVIAAIAASNGENYRYPVTIRLLN